tara:strand:- start:1075 stop:1275 length:201 start_codon:yes stop_codon:yes gene_type:complete
MDMIWLKTKKMILFGVVIGAIGGCLYWHFVGCSSDICSITSVWWRSTLYGALMGGFTFDIIKDYIK